MFREMVLLLLLLLLLMLMLLLFGVARWIGSREGMASSHGSFAEDLVRKRQRPHRLVLSVDVYGKVVDFKVSACFGSRLQDQGSKGKHRRRTCPCVAHERIWLLRCLSMAHMAMSSVVWRRHLKTLSCPHSRIIQTRKSLTIIM